MLTPNRQRKLTLFSWFSFFFGDTLFVFIWKIRTALRFVLIQPAESADFHEIIPIFHFTLMLSSKHFMVPLESFIIFSVSFRPRQEGNFVPFILDYYYCCYSTLCTFLIQIERLGILNCLCKKAILEDLCPISISKKISACFISQAFTWWGFKELNETSHTRLIYWIYATI